MIRRARWFGPGRLGVSALLLSLLVLSNHAAPVNAQTPGSVELVAQSSWVDDGGIFNIQVRVAGASPDSTVVLRVFSPWTERDDFLREDLTENATVLLELDPVVLGDAQETSNEVLGLELLIDGPNTRRAQAIAIEDAAASEEPISEPIEEPSVVLPSLSSDGGSAVYPIEVALFDGDGELTDSFLTSMIELPRSDLRPPLDVAVILESNVASTATADESTEISDVVLDELRIISDAFAQYSSANMALSISPEVLLALTRNGGEEAELIIEQLQTNLGPDQLLPNPVTELEEQAWFDAELTTELAELYEAGSEVTIRAIGIEPDPSIMLLDRTIGTAGLDDLDELGVRGAIVRPAQITPLDRSIFPQALTTRFLIDGDDDIEPLPALVADGGLANHFTSDGGAVLNANRLLADLVLLSLQNPGGRQSVVVHPPPAWQPDATFLNVLLSGLERVPSIRGSSPSQALAETEITPNLGIGTISGPLHRQLNPAIRADSLGSFRTEYREAHAIIESWSTVIGDDNPSRRQLDELLHLSTNHTLTGQDRAGFIEAIYAEIDDQRELSITAPQTETVTLTGRDSVVPIVIENNLDSSASVLLVFSSEELDFPGGSEVVEVLQPGQNRITIPISARASGDSPIQIQVLSPDGLVELGSSVVLVRTFAFSGVGIAIGVVAIIVLLVWWLRHVRGTRGTIAALGEEQTHEAKEVMGV